MKNLSKKFAILISFLFFTFSLGCGHSTSGNTVYYAIGASDATGVGATPLSNGYVFRIDNALDECGADGDLNNLGIPGV